MKSNLQKINEQPISAIKNTIVTAFLLKCKRPFRIKPEFVFILLAILISSCEKKETIELPWEEQIVSVSTPLNAVFFTDENTGHIVGGENWIQGYYLSTDDAGETWAVDSLTNKRLFALQFLADGYGISVGIDGYLFRKDTPQDDWNFLRLPYWDILRDVAYIDRTEGIAVGGAGYSRGVILQIKNNTVVKRDTFNNELAAVHYSDPLTVHVMGYGIVLRSTDGGLTWERSGVNGDFYRAIHFPSATIGYAVGSAGTILKTTDAGLNWKKLRDGSKARVSNVPFRDLYFVDTERGYLVGENGTFWRTTNGGGDWETVKGFPEVDLLGIYVVNGVGYLVSEEGRVFKFLEE